MVDVARVRALPKVELHVHLEGTITAETARDLATRHGIDPATLPGSEGGRYPSRFRDFEHFVELYLAVSSQVRTPDDLATVAAAFARQQADQNVRYSEATFTATTHVNNGMEPAAMWAALRDGFASVPETSVGLIVDAVRNLGAENAEQTIELVDAADAPVVAFGLAGIEGSRPIEEFAHLRAAADALGIGLVIHAGETGPPSEVMGAIGIGADRIGHGIAVVHDRAIFDRVVQLGVPLDVCPTSNVVIGVVADLESHPFGMLWDAGAMVTINSDDPPFFATTLTDEILHASGMAALGEADLAALQRRAIDASFLSAEAKRDLHADVTRWVTAGG